ncbi:MAG: hypothetical protein R3308_09490 [Thiohalobacterales bacterium]|nr:hypothetical protein [Thiohalobacterales bacterium]
MDRPGLDTHQKAHSINRGRRKYGTLAEIGAGQETARWFSGLAVVAELFRYDRAQDAAG